MTRGRLKSLMIVGGLAAALLACREGRVAGDDAASLSLPRGEADEESDDTITLVPPGYERAAAGLTHLFHVNGDVFGTLDPVDGDVLFLNKKGEQLGAARLPEGFEVRDIDIGSSIVLRGDKAAVVIPRKGAVPAALKSVPLPSPNTSVTRNDRGLQMTYGTDARTGTLSVVPLGQGRVLNVTFLGLDGAGNPYAYWEEGSGREIGAWVGRFGADGRPDTAARLDFSDFADVPAVPVAVVPDGTILMMQPMPESVEFIELTLVDGRAGEAREERLGSPRTNVLDVGSRTDAVVDAPYEAGRTYTRPPPHDPEFAAATLTRAREYLNAQWTLQAGNFRQPAIEHNCEPEQGMYWSRPTRLTEEKVGEAVNSVPYKWGGFDSVGQFKQRVASSRPALAGNVCTCREARFNGCMVARATGVDCSGFVSRAWGLNAHNGTSRLAAIAAPLPSLFDLRPGDILNRPGNHVRLFVGFEPGPEVRLRTLESAVSCGGVCERVYTPAQLLFYRPMRLRRP